MPYNPFGFNNPENPKKTFEFNLSCGCLFCCAELKRETVEKDNVFLCNSCRNKYRYVLDDFGDNDFGFSFVLESGEKNMACVDFGDILEILLELNKSHYVIVLPVDVFCKLLNYVRIGLYDPENVINVHYRRNPSNKLISVKVKHKIEAIISLSSYGDLLVTYPKNATSEIYKATVEDFEFLLCDLQGCTVTIACNVVKKLLSLYNQCFEQK